MQRPWHHLEKEREEAGNSTFTCFPIQLRSSWWCRSRKSLILRRKEERRRRRWRRRWRWERRQNEKRKRRESVKRRQKNERRRERHYQYLHSCGVWTYHTKWHILERLKNSCSMILLVGLPYQMISKKSLSFQESFRCGSQSLRKHERTRSRLRCFGRQAGDQTSPSHHLLLLTSLHCAAVQEHYDGPRRTQDDPWTEGDWEQVRDNSFWRTDHIGLQVRIGSQGKEANLLSGMLRWSLPSPRRSTTWRISRISSWQLLRGNQTSPLTGTKCKRQG